ncbi:neprilysin-4-like [Mytilus trossulus]|uniref:neprilysin-4-like n=1 Tax=Mytilus trossulus TaxID=6551 RepID=UPI00300565EC
MDSNGKGKYYIPEDGAAQVKFSRSKREASKLWCKERTVLERILFCVVLLCIGIIGILLVLHAISLQERRVDENQFSMNLSSQDKSDKEQEKNAKICMTRDCVKAAARILQGMNPSANPCDDFYEYACGNWNKVNIIPDDRSSYNTFAKLLDDLQVIVKGLLERPALSSECEAVKKAKYLYHSCINETLIDERGIDPAYDLLEELGGWPVTEREATWSEENFNLIDLMVKLRFYNNKILVDQWVSADDKNSEVNVIQIDQPDLGMPSREYYLKGLDDPIVQMYHRFAVNVAVMLGANKTAAEMEMRDMVQLEVELANVTVPQDKRRDSELLYNKMNISTLQQTVPRFDWLRYLQEVFKPVNKTITSAEEVVVYAPTYLSDMVDIVDKASSRTLTNYLIWRIMMYRITNLPAMYRNVQKEYQKTMYGSEQELSRWRDCVSYVNDNIGNAVGRMFVDEYFDEDAKEIALDMIHGIRAAFGELLEEAEWMDDPTRKVAKEKSDAIAEKIGYPSYIVNDTELDDAYKTVTFHPNTYFENVLANLKSVAINNLEILREPVDRTRWSTTPVVVNAFYSSTKNQIMFPAGILQPPFYGKGYPKSLNYGGIGMVIGHEITHGFDDRGRQFDKNGNLQQWWDNDVITRFKHQAQCIIDQYSNFTLKDVDMNLNGLQTQGENIADNGGLKQAYRAYTNWLKTLPEDNHQPRLPGLSELSDHHLFFLNFAQVWCGTMRPEASVNRIRTGLHSPGRFRVIGTLQNSKEFSEIFSCPNNSYMNPSKKCHIW